MQNDHQLLCAMQNKMASAMCYVLKMASATCYVKPLEGPPLLGYDVFRHINVKDYTSIYINQYQSISINIYSQQFLELYIITFTY